MELERTRLEELVAVEAGAASYPQKGQRRLEQRLVQRLVQNAWARRAAHGAAVSAGAPLPAAVRPVPTRPLENILFQAGEGAQGAGRGHAVVLVVLVLCRCSAAEVQLSPLRAECGARAAGAARLPVGRHTHKFLACIRFPCHACHPQGRAVLVRPPLPPRVGPSP